MPAAFQDQRRLRAQGAFLYVIALAKYLTLTGGVSPTTVMRCSARRRVYTFTPPWRVRPKTSLPPHS